MGKSATGKRAPVSELEKAERWALIETRRGLQPRRVADGLVTRGLSEGHAARVVLEATEEVAASRIATGRNNILIGSLLLAGGIALTLVTLTGFVGGGSGFVLWYGAIGVGGAQLTAGFAQRRFWRARVRRAQALERADSPRGRSAGALRR